MIETQSRSVFTYSVAPPDTALISEDTQNELMMLRDASREIAFRIGDIANALCIQAAQGGYTITEQQIFDAVGRFCGRSGRTVRYYREEARFYDSETRSEFNMLPFSFFVFARSLGERARQVLEYGRDHPACTLDGLRVAFIKGLADVDGHGDQASAEKTVLEASGLSTVGNSGGDREMEGAIRGDSTPASQERQERKRVLVAQSALRSISDAIDALREFAALQEDAATVLVVREGLGLLGRIAEVVARYLGRSSPEV